MIAAGPAQSDHDPDAELVVATRAGPGPGDDK
jgi:hypothetical protein